MDRKGVQTRPRDRVIRLEASKKARCSCAARGLLVEKRRMRVLAVALALVVFAGCGDESPGVDASGGPTLIPPGAGNGPGTGTTPGQGGTTNGGATGTAGTPGAAAELAEIVYVLIGSFNGGDGGGFCTGTLVAKDIVLTAGHCVDTDRMADFSVVAPRAANRPRVTASRVARFAGDYDDPSSPDIGILKLDEPIVLPQYAQMIDVSARVDGGQTVDAMAVTRTAEEPEAPLESSAILKVSSAKALGYEHGFQTSMFSIGGDSGAGLFLVENGKPTHKLIGVARQPEPDRNVDHFTRVDAAIDGWFAEAAAAED
jgi:hypothetical protein